jgi:sulfur transfer protein SufE
VQLPRRLPRSRRASPSPLARVAVCRSQLFFRLDEETAKHTLYQTVMEALGSGMLVLMLLDLVRLFLGIPFHMKGELWACTDCK